MPEPKRALLERLFAQHRKALEGFFRRRIRSRPDAADLAQEVYLRLLRVNDTDAIRNPEGYLYTVASNLVREHAILDQRYVAQADFDQPLAQSESGRPPEIEEFLDTQVRLQRLREVLAQLPPKCQAAVVLKYRQGLSYQEIAEQLHVSPHMVQKYLGQALAHCRKRMAKLR
jgi:RNA polymerase sigma factor (sigma-70 family)